MARFDDPRKLEALLCQLVSWESGTGSSGEQRFPHRVAELLRELPPFARRPELVTPTASTDSAAFATALHLVDGVADTIVLISHYDTVGTAEYGPLQELACHPVQLTDAMRNRSAELDEDAAADARTGNWLFGRGTADMKAGLALHVALLERANREQWPLNLLLLTVSDEEDASRGMRAAVAHLEQLRAQHGLRYVLALNSEPSFPTPPGDERQFVYTGSIGKLLLTALCVGRETHAGTPLTGLTSTYLASWMTRAMEWNDVFREAVHGEATPLPVTLWQRDLRDGYSTQTNSRTAAFYNVFVMRRSAQDALNVFEQVARDAADECTTAYRELCAREHIEPLGPVRVLRFDELVAHARERIGNVVARVLADADPGPGEEACMRAARVADALVVACPELTPAIVVMFAPPYYPPVDSTGHPLVDACVARVRTRARERFDREVERQHWFAGISDLSYATYGDDASGWRAYERNTPGYGSTYSVPFEGMRRLGMPVLNVGPRGKDLHMRTERLDRRSAFEELPELLADLVKFVAAGATERRDDSPSPRDDA